MDDSVRESPASLLPDRVGAGRQPSLLLHHINHAIRLPDPPSYQAHLSLAPHRHQRGQLNDRNSCDCYFHFSHLPLPQLQGRQTGPKPINSEKVIVSEQDSPHQMAQPHHG